MITDIKFTLKEGVFKVGDIFKLSAETLPEPQPLTFQSSNNAIVRVLPDEFASYISNSGCLLEVVGVGTCRISAKSGDVRRFIELTTFPSGYTPPRPVGETLVLNTNYLRLYLGESIQIEPITNPPHLKVEWRSQDYSIADVDKAGIVTGCSKGKTSIVASCKGYTKECVVEVTDLDIKGQVFKIGIGEKFRIPVGHYPSTYKIVWTSSDEEIAPIDWRGIVEGVRKGSVTVKALVETDTGVITKECKVEVHEFFEPWESISKEQLSSLKIFDKYYELIKSNRGAEIRKVKGNDKLPTLYYIRTDNHPFLFNYKVQAVDSDIDKFLLAR